LIDLKVFQSGMYDGARNQVVVLLVDSDFDVLYGMAEEHRLPVCTIAHELRSSLLRCRSRFAGSAEQKASRLDLNGSHTDEKGQAR